MNQEGVGEKTNIARTREVIEKTSEKFMTSEDVTLLPVCCRYTPNLIKGLTRPGFFKPSMDVNSLLSKGIGWLSWGQLKRILEITREQFRTQVERKFVEDLIIYLDYKIREAERIRNERKQMSFW